MTPTLKRSSLRTRRGSNLSIVCIQPSSGAASLDPIWTRHLAIRSRAKEAWVAMSYLVIDVRGIVYDLDEQDTQSVLNVASPTEARGVLEKIAAVAGVSIASGPAAIAVGVIAAWIVAEGLAVKAADKGCGVILTWNPLFPVVIPATRVCGCNIPWRDWAQQDSGTFVSSGGDTVTFAIQHGAHDPSIAGFHIVNNVGQDRQFILRTGGGWEGEITAAPGQVAGNALYANELQNGQKLTFRKPSGFLGFWIITFEIDGLNNVQPGDLVTFTWTA
jgi:hypothetical protein